MRVLSVNYDLREHGKRDYKHLEDAIRKFPNWCHALQSTWYIVTDATPQKVYEYLKPYLGGTDTILIVPADFSAYWCQGLSQEILDWLKKIHDQQMRAA